MAERRVHPDSVRRLDGASGQVEALTRFLEECRRHAARAALLVLRDGRVEVWKSVGFSGADGDRRALDPSEALDRAIAGVPQRLKPGNDVSRALGAADATAAVLVPFVVREKVSGAVYADGAGEALDVDAIAVLTYLAGLVVDRLAKRKLVPSPPLAPWEAPAAEDVPQEPEPAALAGPLAQGNGDADREEARRFARLLASEIKLYNEHAVAVGRKHGNLYALLAGDIERGRALYEERVPRETRAGADYYYEELLEVLAGGDAKAWGQR
ncbi:MAG: hypothetical protein M3547_08325 [Acidobacteriota bacterium]|nr:hypothetical protein [Acidobacteriota bacterium]